MQEVLVLEVQEQVEQEVQEEVQVQEEQEEVEQVELEVPEQEEVQVLLPQVLLVPEVRVRGLEVQRLLENLVLEELKEVSK